jgi:hypothetical protein
MRKTAVSIFSAFVPSGTLFLWFQPAVLKYQNLYELPGFSCLETVDFGDKKSYIISV